MAGWFVCNIGTTPLYSILVPKIDPLCTLLPVFEVFGIQPKNYREGGLWYAFTEQIRYGLVFRFLHMV